MNEDRSRSQSETNLASTLCCLNLAVKELTEAMRQMTTHPLPAKPMEPEKPDMEEVNKVVELFGF